MGGDNTESMMMYRSYKRLMISILENAPKPVQVACLNEYEDLVKEHITLGEVLRDSKNYFVHYQSGRAILINRETPLSHKIINEGELAKMEKEDRILRRRMQNRPLPED